MNTNTIQLSTAAQENVEETGCDPMADLNALRTGEHTRETLLAHCLNGAICAAAVDYVTHAKEMAAAFVEEFGHSWDDATCGDWDSTAFEGAPTSDFAAWKREFVAETKRLTA